MGGRRVAGPCCCTEGTAAPLRLSGTSDCRALFSGPPGRTVHSPRSPGPAQLCASAAPAWQGGMRGQGWPSAGCADGGRGQEPQTRRQHQGWRVPGYEPWVEALGGSEAGPVACGPAAASAGPGSGAPVLNPREKDSAGKVAARHEGMGVGGHPAWCTCSSCCRSRSCCCCTTCSLACCSDCTCRALCSACSPSSYFLEAICREAVGSGLGGVRWWPQPPTCPDAPCSCAPPPRLGAAGSGQWP